MCSVPAASLGLGAAGMATQFWAKMEEGRQNKAAAEAQAELQDHKAEISMKQSAFFDQQAEWSEDDARIALLSGRLEEKEHRNQVKAVNGYQRTMFAANGIEVDSGSALQVQGDTVAMGEADSLMIRYNALQKARGFKRDAVSSRFSSWEAKEIAKSQRRSAYHLRRSGTAAMTAAMIGGTATALTGASRLTSSWSQYRSETSNKVA